MIGRMPAPFFQRDQIDLSDPASEVLLKDDKTCFAKICGGNLFIFAAQFPFVHILPLSVVHLGADLFHLIDKNQDLRYNLI